jgi:hypothetical protein
MRDQGLDDGVEPLPVSVQNIADLERRTSELFGMGYKRVVWKSDLSSAGRGHHHPDNPPSKNDLAFAHTQFTSQSPLTVAPWLRKIADLSIHVSVSEEGAVRVDGCTRFLTDDKGRYIGVVVGHPLALAPRIVHEMIQRRYQGFAPFVETLGHAVGGALFLEGHRGPASFDLLLHDRSSAPALVPLLEVNPRLTMGRVGLRFQDLVKPGRLAAWLQISRRRLKAHGFGDFHVFVQSLDTSIDLDHGRLLNGIVFTTPPETAESLVTLLAVGEGITKIEAAVPSLAGALAWPEPRAPIA